ncbi:MAG TPA: hypothetical protein VGL66_06860 [Caulobacteraceae bacterium]
MKTFSVARAFSAGVDLIERKPMVLVWWAAAVLVLQLIPRLVISHMAGANEFDSMRDVMGSLNDQAKLQIAQQHLKASEGALGIWGLGLWAWSLFVYAILYNAVFRAVLEPQKSSFGYLRLGAAEFWQFAVQIVIFILVMIYTFTCIMLFFFIAAASAVAAPEVRGWIVGLTLVALFLLTLWLALRLSLGSVATFAERRFAYFDSWKLTKGVSWRLFWTGVLLTALIIGLEIMLFASAIFSLVPLAGLLPSPGAAAPTVPVPHGLDVADLLSIASLATLVRVLLLSLVTALFQALMLPPWAVIYRNITGGAEEVAH